MEHHYLQISSKKLSILHSLHFRGLTIKIESPHIRVPRQWWQYLYSDMCLWRIVLCRHCTERCYINWLEAAARHITRFTAADYRLQRKNFFLLVSISFLCKEKIILRSWVLKQMQKNIEISTSWPGRRHLHYMLRFIIFWQTLWIHSYSPNLESKVPRCNERSLSVNLGPSSWSPAFFWFLKIYLRRTCKKNEKKSAIKETLSVNVVRWWLRLAFEQALLVVLFGQAKRVSRERASEGPLPASPLARAFSRESFHSPK